MKISEAVESKDENHEKVSLFFGLNIFPTTKNIYIKPSNYSNTDFCWVFSSTEKRVLETYLCSTTQKCCFSIQL